MERRPPKSMLELAVFRVDQNLSIHLTNVRCENKRMNSETHENVDILLKLGPLKQTIVQRWGMETASKSIEHYAEF